MFFNRLATFVLQTPQVVRFELQQVRNKWPDHRMKRDYFRRKLVEKENITRLRINALRKNTILRREIQEVADTEIAALPYRSSITHLTNRCRVTSRARGTVLRWHLSRFVFRDLVDYNKMSGLQRAMW